MLNGEGYGRGEGSNVAKVLKPDVMEQRRAISIFCVSCKTCNTGNGMKSMPSARPQCQLFASTDMGWMKVSRPREPRSDSASITYRVTSDNHTTSPDPISGVEFAIAELSRGDAHGGEICAISQFLHTISVHHGHRSSFWPSLLKL
jgi:hypothetical protein